MRSFLKDWHIPFAVREVLLDHPPAGQLLSRMSKDLNCQEMKLVVNWLSGDILALINKKDISWSDVLAFAIICSNCHT